MIRKAKALIFIISLAAVLLATVPFLIRDYQRNREWLYHYSCRSICRHLDSAKDQYALAHHLADGDLINPDDISEYFPWNRTPGCPGRYTMILGRIGEDPRCVRHGVYAFNPMPPKAVLQVLWMLPPFSAIIARDGEILGIEANHVLENIGTDAPNSQH